MDRCNKCGGFIFTDKDSIRCMNCGKRFYQKDNLSELHYSYCKKCGKEIVAPTRNQKLCDECKKRPYRKKKICSVCGKEFIAKSRKSTKCKECRKPNRNEFYIYRNKILSNNLRKIRESKHGHIEK